MHHIADHVPLQDMRAVIAPSSQMLMGCGSCMNRISDLYNLMLSADQLIIIPMQVSPTDHLQVTEDTGPDSRQCS